MSRSPVFPAFRDTLPILGVDGSLAMVTDYKSDPTLAGATGRVRAKTGTYVDGTPSGQVLKGQALGGYITTRSGRRLAFQLTVNNVPVSDIDDIVQVFQDEGRVSAILWRDYPIVQNLVMLIAFCVVVVNFLVDMAYMALDPRIKYAD